MNKKPSLAQLKEGGLGAFRRPRACTRGAAAKLDAAPSGSRSARGAAMFDRKTRCGTQQELHGRRLLQGFFGDTSGSAGGLRCLCQISVGFVF